MRKYVLWFVKTLRSLIVAPESVIHALTRPQANLYLRHSQEGEWPVMKCEDQPKNNEPD
jgi:hypothetical protein